MARITEGMARALPQTKSYPGPNGAAGERNLLGRRSVDVRCSYEVTLRKDDGSTETRRVAGTEKVSVGWIEDGWELVCRGVEMSAVWVNPGGNGPSEEFMPTGNINPFSIQGSGIPELEGLIGKE